MKVESFIFLVDFITLYFEVDFEFFITLGRAFLMTKIALVDIKFN